MLALLGARSVLGLCLCPFGRLYKCYPPVSSYAAWIFLLLNLFSSFSLLTRFVTRVHYNTMGLILPTLMSSAIYRKCYISSWFMYDVYCDTITGKHVPWMFVSYLYVFIKLPRFAYSVIELSHLQGVEDEHWHLTVLCVWQLRARPNNGTSEPERCMVQQTAI